jgi:hypothetical protein
MLKLRRYETEAGEIPARSRHCNRLTRFGVRLKVRPLVTKHISIGTRNPRRFSDVKHTRICTGDRPRRDPRP